MARVYVSSTHEDLQAERREVIDWLIAAGHQPVHSYTPDSKTLQKSCLEDIDGCDLYVLILGHRYGHRPEANNPEELSITHLEFRRARAADIPRIALLRTSIPNVALSDIHDPHRWEAVTAFQDEVRREVRTAEFEDLAGLIQGLSTGVQRELDKLRDKVVLSLPDLQNCFQRASRDLLSWQITLPNDRWLERPELEILLRRIEDESGSLTLLLGEPGCGKSALLARLGKHLEQQSITVLGIKADFLPESIRDHDELADYLRLPDSAVSCVRSLAQKVPVVVLLDQLDALADLVVQHSQRLRVPLELIHDLADLDNVHIVASCRLFEYRHDPRLRHLRAEELNMVLPSWEQVDAVLQDYGVHAGSWNETMRDVLCSPHALNTFLRLMQSPDESHLLHSYQGMLKVLWEQSVLCDATDGRRRLLLDMAQRMAEREVLWLPLVSFEDRYPVVQELVAAGLLVKDFGGDRIGYRHQTMYEFVRARTFLEIEGSLTETVLARQDSLRIRPQLWHALGYFRDVDRATYLVEIRRLWDADNLRPHLRILLIEFLGQLQDPEPGEVRLFVQRFDDAWYRTRIVSAVVGNPEWFEKLAQGQLPMLMTRSAQEAAIVLPLLIQALDFAQETVLKLLDRYWLPYPDKDDLSWRVLEDAKDWNKSLIDRLCRIIARTDLVDWKVNHVASLVSMTLPEQAPRLPAAWLSRVWQRNVQPDDEADNGLEASFRENSRAERSRNLLEGRELHDIPAIAEVAPLAFLDTLWPWFLQVLEDITDEPHPFIIGYRQHGLLIDDIDDGENEREFRIERPLLMAFELAMEQLAKQQPEAFLIFAKANEELDYRLVQCLLAKGMVNIVSRYPAVVLDFLCQDPRRLVLGPSSNCHGNSQALIQALVPHLDSEQFRQLEQTLLAWNRYSGSPPDEDVDTRFRRRRWNREHRLRLLRVLPRDRMSEICRRMVEEEERAFPDLCNQDIRFSGMRFIDSPVSAQQMQAGRDEDILNLFEELTDDHDWDHPKRSMEGGAIQAGRELAKLAEKDPKRAVRLVSEFKPGQNEIPVSEVLGALAKTDYDRSSLYALILDLTEKGFGSEPFRRSAANAAEQIVSADHPLPELLFERLESWLEPLNDSMENEIVQESSTSDQDKSLLWGYAGARVLPNGNYPILAALSAACLRTRPPRVDRWLDILERHIQRDESHRAWVAMYRYLERLHLAERDRAQAFLDRLFHIYPSILGTLEGIRLLATFQHWIDPYHSQHWLIWMARMGDRRSAQGSGELLMYRRALFPDETWAADRIADVLHTDASVERTDLVRIGIAYTVARLWSESEYRELVHGYLLELIRDNDTRVHKALAAIFRTKGLISDRFTGELLDAICEYPTILRYSDAEFLVEALEILVDMEPDRVYGVCINLLDQVGNHMGNPATSWFLASEALVTVALALQDMDESYRANGTALLERILEFNLPYAREMLTDLDKRTVNRSSMTGFQRRRRKYRRKAKR